MSGSSLTSAPRHQEPVASGQVLAGLHGTEAGVDGQRARRLALRVAVLDDQRTAGRQPVERLGDDRPDVIEAVGTGPECLARLPFVDQRRERLRLGHIGRVRRDHADVFATLSEGMQGADAVAWKLVDEVAPPSTFADAVTARASAMAATSDRGGDAVILAPLERTLADDAVRYRFVSAELDRAGRTVRIDVTASADHDWPLTCARELDDLLCHLRFNEPDLGTLVISTSGDVADVLAHDEMLVSPSNHAERETSLFWKRVLSRLDLTARTIFATIEPGSCFAGVLAELALAADRSYMLDGIFEDADDPLPAATIQLTAVNAGPMPMINGLTRLQSRFISQPYDVPMGTPLVAADALAAGLVTFAPDDLDWDDEVRLAVEERASFSPDALTGMEANHRFAGPETMATKIFSRLSAWQNWIFIRPNASGPDGALRKYGSGSRPTYDINRT